MQQFEDVPKPEKSPASDGLAVKSTKIASKRRR
jgi:hypothetical protein